METWYELPEADQIPYLSPSQLLETQRNISNRMWELRHHFDDSGIRQSKYSAAQQAIWVEKARMLRRLIQSELIRRKSNSSDRKQTAQKILQPVNQILCLEPATARLILRQRKPNIKEQYVALYHTERQPQQQLVNKRQPKRQIVQVESKFKSATSRTIEPRVPRLKRTLETAHRTQVETILHTQTHEQQKVEIIHRSNMLSQKSEQTSRLSQKPRSKSKSKKQKSAMMQMMLQLLEKTRVNDGPVTIGKGMKKHVQPIVQPQAIAPEVLEQQNQTVQVRSNNPQTLRSKRSEILKTMKARSENKSQNKEITSPRNQINARNQKRLVEFARKRQESKGNVISNAPQFHIEQPIEQDIKIQDEAQYQEATKKVSKTIQLKESQWSYQNQFLQPPPIREELEQSGDYDNKSSFYPGSKRSRKIPNLKPKGSYIIKSKNMVTRA